MNDLENSSEEMQVLSSKTNISNKNRAICTFCIHLDFLLLFRISSMRVRLSPLLRYQMEVLGMLKVMDYTYLEGN